MISIYDLYRIVFHRRMFFRLNLILFKIALRGIGILNYEDGRVSGESCFLRSISPKISTAFDVGANEGDYSKKIKNFNPQVDVLAFEPHPQTYRRLHEAGRTHSFKTFNFAMGKEKQIVKLFDYKGLSGSSHATLYRDAIEKLRGKASIAYDIEVRTIDDVADELHRSSIDLLKIDTEGNEYDVLLGASKLLCSGNIKIIHFEFNEMNVFSRKYLTDFTQLLRDFTIFRMIQDGIVPLSHYAPYFYEIFAYQNIVAIHNNEVEKYSY